MQFGEPPRNIIDYDGKCFSCSEQPKKIISAFKMACLSYKPGKVVYNGDTLSRDALIGISGGVADELDKNRVEAADLIKTISLSLLSGKTPAN